MLSFISLCLAGFTLIALYQIYRFVIRPKSQLEFYKNQGLPVIFAPFSGFRKQAFEDLQNNKDLLHTWKQINYMNPKPRAFASNLGPYPLVALKDPELIKQFYTNQEKCYIKAPAGVDIPKLILRNGVIVAEGEQWKQHKKLGSPLYSYENLKEMTPEIVQIIDERLEKLKGKNLKEVNMLTEIQNIFMEVTGKLFLGMDLSPLEFKGKTVSAFVAEIIDRAGAESFEAMTILFGTDVAKMGIHPRQKALVKDISDLRAFLFGAAKGRLQEILATKDAAAAAGKRPLLLQLIYEQMVKMNDSKLDAVDLVDEFANFSMGMMDTTAHATLFASYFVLQNTSAHKKLLEESEKTFKDTTKVTQDTINQMDYASAVLKETLRMAAPLPYFLPRVATQDHTLGDLKIRAGTVVVLAAVSNSFDPDYHDEPEKFVPERWLDENSRTRKAVNKNSYVYIPYSSGHKVCAGMQMGMTLVKTFIGLFVKKFNYEHSDKNYEMMFSSKFFSEPHHPLVYNMEVRK